MSETTTRPAWKRPGATTSPTFSAWNVTVRSACTAAPLISPVDASTPEGRSTETTGAGVAFIRSISSAAAGRGSPLKPVPKSASTTTSYVSSSSAASSATCPASRSSRAATRPSPPFEPPPQTHANRRAAGYASIASRATAAPARSMSSGIVSG
jgi:hypothetical protein